METFRAKAKHDEELLKESYVPFREIAVARIRPPDMRTERTARARRIVVVGELILLSCRPVGPGNRLLFCRHHRIARLRSASDFRAELAGLLEIPTGPVIEKLPKLSDILFQLAHDQISDVAAKIFFCWSVLPFK